MYTINIMFIKQNGILTDLIFFVDDIKYITYPKAGDSKEMWPYNEPEYLLLNIAVGGDWGGLKGIDDAIFPQKMVIDYVRIYQLKD